MDYDRSHSGHGQPQSSGYTVDREKLLEPSAPGQTIKLFCTGCGNLQGLSGLAAQELLEGTDASGKYLECTSCTRCDKKVMCISIHAL